MTSVRVRADDGRAEEGREDGTDAGKSAPNTAQPLTEGANSARGELGSCRVWPLLGRSTAKEKERWGVRWGEYVRVSPLIFVQTDIIIIIIIDFTAINATSTFFNLIF